MEKAGCLFNLLFLHSSEFTLVIWFTKQFNLSIFGLQQINVLNIKLLCDSASSKALESIEWY